MNPPVQGMTPSDWIAIAAILVGALLSAFTLIWQTRAERSRRHEDRVHERQRIEEQHAREHRAVVHSERAELYIRILDLATRQYTAFYTRRRNALEHVSRTPIETVRELLDEWTALEAEVGLLGPGEVLHAMREFEAALMRANDNDFAPEPTKQMAELEGRMAIAMREDLEAIKVHR